MQRRLLQRELVGAGGRRLDTRADHRDIGRAGARGVITSISESEIMVNVAGCRIRNLLPNERRRRRRLPTDQAFLACSARRRKRSTWPPVSTMRCVPVKNGWHTEHTSVFSSVSVEPVVKVLPQRQCTSASTWYSGWIVAFIGAPRFTRKGRSDDTTLGFGSIQRHRHRTGEVTVGDAGEPVDEVLIRRRETDSVIGEQAPRREDINEPVVVA